MDNSSIKMLEIAARGFDDLLERITFVGGAITSLYIDDVASITVRPTDDVDCVIEIISKTEYYELENTIRKLGMSNSIEPGDPICRWIYENVKIDIMPIDPEILGFSNRWYKEGIKHSIKRALPSGIEISIFSLHHFIASKIEAHKSRGDTDLRFSNDLEDIIIVMDGLKDLSIFYNSPEDVKTYFKEEFFLLQKNQYYIESFQAFLGTGPTSTARTARIIDFLKDFTT